MSPTEVLDELGKQAILPPEQRTQLATLEASRPLSLHWELRSLLYMGILLLSTGVGLLVYDHFDAIGHGALLAAIAVACAGCFFFAWRFRPEWTWLAARSRSAFGDYALILACLFFLTLEGYAQYAYTVFGTRYGLATLLPALLFLGLAYRFDHRGVLGMAITAFISWVGVTVKPLQLFFKTNFFDRPTVFWAMGLALVLIGVALGLQHRRIKPHFTYTYLVMAGNLLLVAILGGLFNFNELRLVFVAALLTACAGFDWYARREQSFLFLLMSTVYGYIGVTYLFFQYIHPSNTAIYWYFILTGSLLVYYLMRQLPKQSLTP